MSGSDKNQMSLSNYEVYQLYKEGKRLTRQSVSLNANAKKPQIVPEVEKEPEIQKKKEKKCQPKVKSKKGKVKPQLNQSSDQKSLEDEDSFSKEAPVIQKKVKHQVKEIKVEVEVIKQVPEKINLRKRRCGLCNFILCFPAFKQCQICKKTFHERCLIQCPEKGTEKNKEWICSDCQPCSICETIKASIPIVKCEECNIKFHFSCGFGLTAPTNLCYCPQCQKCQWCQMGFKSHQQYTAMDGEFLCVDCVEIKIRKQYCLVCKTVWINNDAEYKRDYIQCVSNECEMWVHKDCDPVLKDDPSLFKSYSKDQKSVYRCPKCREQIRSGIIEDTIRFLSYFDVDKLFWMVDFTNNKYLQVIKNPMDFVTLYKKNKKGNYQSTQDPYRAFMSDVKLILDNCLLYNLPNTKFHRKALLLQAIYNIIFPKLKLYLFDLEEITILEYSEKQMGLVNHMVLLMRKLGKWFLDEAFTTSNNQVKIIGQAWDGAWERQQLAFSPFQVISDNAFKDDRLLVANERKYNPGVCYLQLEDKNEPLIKFSFHDFATNLLSTQITIKVGGFKGLLSRIKVQAHPYLLYLITESSKPAQKHDPNMSSQNDMDHTLISFDQHSQQQGFESELQAIFTKILTNDSSKMKVQPPAMPSSLELMIEFICHSCGTYEHKNNLLFCSNCGDSHHFFCQIQNANLVPSRVLAQLHCNITRKWLCLKCVQCLICRKSNSKSIDLFCQTCGNFYHFKCVFPQFQAISEPLDFWRCPQCFSCENCKSKSYIDDHKLALIQQKSGSQNGGQLTLSIDYFQNFQYCLLCGLGVTGKRFCDLCGEYVNIDAEMEVVLPTTAKTTFRQYLQPAFWDYSKQEDNIFNVYFEDLNKLSQTLKRQPLNYLTKDGYKESAHHCKRCQRLYHDACMKQEGIQFNDKGFCQHCQLDYSDVLFKYEQCKQEQVRRQVQERKLKQVQPFLFYFLEEIQKKQIAPKKTTKKLQFPELSEEQTQIVLDNLDQFETLITQFKTSFQTIQAIKENFLNQPDIHDEYLEKLVQYWSIKFGSMDYTPNINAPSYKEEMVSYEAPDDVDERLLEFLLLRDGQFCNYLTFNYLQGFSTYVNEVFGRGMFPWHDYLQLHLSGLQCNFVEHLVQTPYYQYMKEDFYVQEIIICDQQPIPLISYYPGLSGTKKIRNDIIFKYWNYNNHHQEQLLLQSSDMNDSSQVGQFRYEIQQLKDQYNDEHINEQFRSFIISLKQLNVSVLEMSELYLTALQQSQDLKTHEQTAVKETTVQKMQPLDQAKYALEKVNKIISIVANQKQKDILLSSPLDNTMCQICFKNGHRRMSGLLLYCDGTRWVHQNCALWSNEVKENHQEFSLSGVFQVLKILRNGQTKCNICSQHGASMSCISANCKKKVHFYCAYVSNFIFLSSKKLICNSCILDVQAFCVDQLNQTAERVKSSLLKNVVNEAISAQAVNDFSCWRKLVVINSQKWDKQFCLEQSHLRFGNTILLDITQSDNRPLFKNIQILVNRQGSETLHKFVGVQFVNSEYVLSYREFTKIQFQSFVNSQMEVEGVSNKSPQYLIKKIFDSCDQFPIRTFQQLQSLLYERKLFPQYLGELVTYEDSVGNMLLLFTQFVRTRLNDKAKADRILTDVEQLNKYHHWFLIDGVYEDLQQQTRLAYLQAMVTQTNLESEVVQKKHPTLMDLTAITKHDKALLSNILSPLKLVLSPQVNPLKEKINLDKFTLQGGLTPNDIFLEADLEVHNNNNPNYVNEVERQKGIERNLKLEYQLIDSNKKKCVHLYVAPSRIHKYGLFTKQKIKQFELVIEYTGELIRNSLADERERSYVEKGFGDCYMFRASKEKVIDATFLGSQARYLNHSCDPNCASAICEFNEQPKILMYAKREIQQNEELTYDYQFEVEADKIQCYCGAKNCLGRLN